MVAAYVTSKLFNDWKDEHNKDILAQEAKEVFHLFHKQRNYLNDTIFLCKRIVSRDNSKLVLWTNFIKEYDHGFLDLYHQDKDKMSEFCVISRGQVTYDLTTTYIKSFKPITEYLNNIKIKDTK